MQKNVLGGGPVDVRSGSIRIRSLSEQDLPLLLSWLSDDRVLAFYGGRDLHYDAATLRAHYDEPIGEDYCRVAIEFDGTPVGYAQIYCLDSKQCIEYGYARRVLETVYAMDQFIGVPDLWDHGIGTEYLRTILKLLTDCKHADAVLVDPHADNVRAIRAYEKAGFVAAGILPEHELFEGERKDCLLMVHRASEHAG